MGKRTYEGLLLAPLALTGIFTILYVSKVWGIGLSPDSTTYIRVARTLLPGPGLNEMARSTFPPLYPTMLAIGARLGMDPLNSTRWLNAVLFGANIVLAGVVIRVSTHSLLGGLLGSFLTLSSIGILTVHSMAWSESLFLFFTVLGLALLAAHLENPTGWHTLCASATATTLAFLDRYIGAASVMASLLGIVCFSKAAGRRKARDALMFGVISGLPTGLWILYSMHVAGGVAGRRLVYHPLSPEQLRSALDTFRSWLDPKGVPHVIARHPLAFVTLGTLTVGVAIITGFLRPRGRRWSRRSDAKSAYHTRLVVVLTAFIVIYSGMLIFAISYTDMGADLGLRTLAPIYVPGLIVTASLVSGHIRSATRVRFLTEGVVLLCAALAGSYFLEAATWVSDAHDRGLGYASEKWRQSPIIQRIRSLPSGIGIYTNGPDAIYILTGKPAEKIPPKFDGMTGLKNTDYAAQMRAMSSRLEANKAVLVYIDARMWLTPRTSLPTEFEVLEAMRLRLIERVSDGAIYGGEP